MQAFGDEAAVESVLIYRAYGSESTHTRPLESLLSFFRELDSICAEHAEYRASILEKVSTHNEALQPLLPSLFSQSTSSASAGPSTFAGRRLKQGVIALLDAMNSHERRTLFLFDNLDHADDVSRSILVNWASNNRRARRGNLLLIATATSPISSDLSGALGDCVDVLEPLQEKELRELLGSMAGSFPNLFTDDRWQLRWKPRCGRFDDSKLGGLWESNLSGWQMAGTRHCDRLESIARAESKAFAKPAARYFARVRAITARGALCWERPFIWMKLRVWRAESISGQERHRYCASPSIRLGNANHNDFGFLYDEIHQSFLEELEPRYRKSLHLRAIRMIGTQNESRCFELANHYDAAELEVSAINFSILAAKRSQEQFASDLAIHYLSMARSGLSGFKVAKSSLSKRSCVRRIYRPATTMLQRTRYDKHCN